MTFSFLTHLLRFSITVSRIERDDHAPISRARRRGESVRAGAQVAGPGPNEIFGAEALHRGHETCTVFGREPVPKRSASGLRFSIESYEVAI